MESRGTESLAQATAPVAIQTDDADVLTVAEIAHYLRVTTKTVYGLFRRGELTSFRIGRVVRCRRTDLMRFVDQRCEATGRSDAGTGRRSEMG